VRLSLPARQALVEFLGSAGLVAVVIGSGIAAQRLSPTDTGLQLLENALITGAGLVALILAFGPAGPVAPGSPRSPSAPTSPPPTGGRAPPASPTR
jgi:hypothetical protein